MTYHNSNSRTGLNPDEQVLNKTKLQSGLWSFTDSVAGQVYAQPLFLPAIKMLDGKIHNVAFVATETNDVYCMGRRCFPDDAVLAREPADSAKAGHAFSGDGRNDWTAEPRHPVRQYRAECRQRPDAIVIEVAAENHRLRPERGVAAFQQPRHVVGIGAAALGQHGMQFDARVGTRTTSDVARRRSQPALGRLFPGGREQSSAICAEMVNVGIAGPPPTRFGWDARAGLRELSLRSSASCEPRAPE